MATSIQIHEFNWNFNGVLSSVLNCAQPCCLHFFPFEYPFSRMSYLKSYGLQRLQKFLLYFVNIRLENVCWGWLILVRSSTRIRNELRVKWVQEAEFFLPMGHCRCPCLHSVTLGFGFTVSGGTTSSIAFQFSRTCSDRASLSLPDAERKSHYQQLERERESTTPCQFTARQRLRPFTLTVCKSCFSQGFWKCQAYSDAAGLVARSPLQELNL